MLSAEDLESVPWNENNVSSIRVVWFGNKPHDADAWLQRALHWKLTAVSNASFVHVDASRHQCAIVRQCVSPIAVYVVDSTVAQASLTAVLDTMDGFGYASVVLQRTDKSCNASYTKFASLVIRQHK